jgi:hypothetical protein
MKAGFSDKQYFNMSGSVKKKILNEIIMAEKDKASWALELAVAGSKAVWQRID